MIGLDIKHPYQNVAIATFLHFLGESQENETWKRDMRKIQECADSIQGGIAIKRNFLLERRPE